MTEGTRLNNEKNNTSSMFLGEINLDKIIIPPTQSTEPRTLIEAPGAGNYSLCRRLKQICKFAIYTLRLLGISILNALLYGLIFGLAYILGKPMAAYLYEIGFLSMIPFIENRGPSGIFLVLLSISLCAIMIFFLFNFFGLLGGNKYWNRDCTLHATPPVSPLNNKKFKDAFLHSREINMGLQNVRYGYTDKALYILGSTNAFMTAIEFSQIKNVEWIENKSGSERWKSGRGTRGIKLTIGQGATESDLYLHGIYMEDKGGNKPDKGCARDFFEGLRKKACRYTPNSNKK